jgi:hypothetical protein
MRHRRRKTGEPRSGADAERTIQQGRFLCPREGVERTWRVIAIHRTYTGHAEGTFEQVANAAYASALVCDGCLHRFDLEAGRPMTEAERDELFRSGLAMTLSALSREHVDDPPVRAAEIARASTASGLASLPTFDPIGFEALARRLDAHLLPDQREELITIACDVSRSGNVTPSFSSVLQILGGALGYSMEEIKSRLAA